MAAVTTNPAPVAASSRAVCEGGGPVAEVLEKILRIDASCQSEPNCRREKRKILEEALERFPEDVLVHVAFQDASQTLPRNRAGEKMVERYRSLLETHPGSARFFYLYGRALRATGGSEEALIVFRRALEADPEFPWAHFAALSEYLRPEGNSSEDPRAKEHIEAFERLCPTSPEIYDFALRFSDRDFVQKRVESLRQLVERRMPEEPLRFLRYSDSLWRAELGLASPSEREEVRARVRVEIERIRSLDLQNSRPWWDVLRDGYQHTGDAAAERAAQEEIGRRFPCTFEGADIREQLWQKEHPRFPSGPAGPEWMGYHRALYEASGEWVRSCPDAMPFWLSRFSSALALKGLSESELVEVIDGFFSSWEDPDVSLSVSMSPSPYLTAAKAYVERGIHLEQVSDFARKAMEESENEYQWLTTAFTGKPQAPLQEMRDRSRWEAWSLTAAADVQLERLTEARATLSLMKTFLDEKGLEQDLSGRLRWAEYWRTRGALAEKEGRPADALGFYNTASRHYPGDRDAMQASRRLSRELGGSRDRPQVREAIDTARWSGEERKLPEFQIADLAGKNWSLQSLKGKTTLVNVWASWCGPCRRELPFIQKFHDDLRDRADLLVLTFNVDDNPGLVEPFVNENKVTMPVLFASVLVRSLLGEIVIPRTWIVDREGTLRWEWIGFGAETEKWTKEVLALLEQTARQR